MTVVPFVFTIYLQLQQALSGFNFNFITVKKNNLDLYMFLTFYNQRFY